MPNIVFSSIPTSTSPELRDLLMRMLKRDAEERISFGKVFTIIGQSVLEFLLCLMLKFYRLLNLFSDFAHIQSNLPINRPATHTDFISIYRFFLPSKFCKILVFTPIIWQNTDFFPKMLIFLVIYTDFVLDQSGRSA